MLLLSNLHAQKQANIWYFGDSAGMDFNFDPPQALTNGVMVTGEGSSSVCDENGKLLFYTNGGNKNGGDKSQGNKGDSIGGVWNSNHELMPNGLLLDTAGSWSSYQGVIICPKPKDKDKYYIFTIDGAEECSFVNDCDFYKYHRYSIVDMSLDNGLGDVTVKGVPLPFNIFVDNSGNKRNEAISIIPHKNGIDYWGIVHSAWDSVGIFLIDETGIQFSNYYKIESIPDKQFVVSPKNDVVAFTRSISKFNNETGVLTHWFKYPQSMDYVAISSNGKVLYIERSKDIFQYDLSLNDSASVVDSKITITTQTIKAMRLAPDGKIYVFPTNSEDLHVINCPNTIGLGCDFVVDAFNLNGKSTRSGGPNFIQSLFYKPDLPFNPILTIGPGASICAGDTVSLSVSADSLAYIWSPGASLSNSFSTNPLAFPDSTTQYRVDISAIDGCDVYDTSLFVTVTVNEPELTIVQNDTNLCSSIPFQIEAQSNGTITWSNGASGNTINITPISDTTLVATATLAPCMTTDSIKITLTTTTIQITQYDSDPCLGDNIVIIATGNGTKVWDNGFSGDTLESTALITKTYTVTTNINNCTASDSILIQLCNEEVVELSLPNVFSPNGDGVNELFNFDRNAIELFELQVYNRWGDLMYEGSEESIGWDGRTQSGKPAPEGVYFYTLSGTNFGVSMKVSGDISLFR